MKIQDVQAALSALVNDLLLVKGRLQQGVPIQDLSCSRLDATGKVLIAVHDQLKEMLVQLGLIDERDALPTMTDTVPVASVDEEGILLLCGRNAILDKITSLRTAFLDAMSTGGPLESRHYKELNPSLPDQALKGIERKIEKTLDTIKGRSAGKHLAIIIGVAGDTSDRLLASSASRLQAALGIDTRVLELPSLDVREGDFITMLGGVSNQ